MGIIARKHDTKRTNYNQLQGSGLLPVGPVCVLAKCKPKSQQPVPTSPVPKSINRPAPKPLVAIKASKSSNKWSLNGLQYPDFNSFWVNIPKMSYTIMRTNG